MGRKFAGIDEMAAAARELVAGGIETVVVSLGGDGALFVQARIRRCAARD